jgi:hypothetical protein
MVKWTGIIHRLPLLDTFLTIFKFIFQQVNKGFFQVIMWKLLKKF